LTASAVWSTFVPFAVIRAAPRCAWASPSRIPRPGRAR